MPEFPRIPTNIRLYLSTLLGARDPITEKDFYPEELDVMRRSVQRMDKPRGSMGYSDFGRTDKSGLATSAQYTGTSLLDNLFQSLTNPDMSVQLSLGMVNFDKSSGHAILKDQYDFGATPEQMNSLSWPELLSIGADALKMSLVPGPYEEPTAILNLLGNLVVPQGRGRDVHIDLGPAKTKQPKKARRRF